MYHIPIFATCHCKGNVLHSRLGDLLLLKYCTTFPLYNLLSLRYVHMFWNRWRSSSLIIVHCPPAQGNPSIHQSRPSNLVDKYHVNALSYSAKTTTAELLTASAARSLPVVNFGSCHINGLPHDTNIATAKLLTQFCFCTHYLAFLFSSFFSSVSLVYP